LVSAGGNRRIAVHRDDAVLLSALARQFGHQTDARFNPHKTFFVINAGAETST